MANARTEFPTELTRDQLKDEAKNYSLYVVGATVPDGDGLGDIEDVVAVATEKKTTAIQPTTTEILAITIDPNFDNETAVRTGGGLLGDNKDWVALIIDGEISTGEGGAKITSNSTTENILQGSWTNFTQFPELWLNRPILPLTKYVMEIEFSIEDVVGTPTNGFTFTVKTTDGEGSSAFKTFSTIFDEETGRRFARVTFTTSDTDAFYSPWFRMEGMQGVVNIYSHSLKQITEDDSAGNAGMIPVNVGKTYGEVLEILDTGTNNDTLAISILETSTELQTLSTITAGSKILKIALDINAKGTGDWTISIHNSGNVAVASETVINATLPTSGWHEFITPFIAESGEAYHIHIISTVADGSIKAGTTDDLETCNFQLVEGKRIKNIENEVGGQKQEVNITINHEEEHNLTEEITNYSNSFSDILNFGDIHSSDSTFDLVNAKITQTNGQFFVIEHKFVGGIKGNPVVTVDVTTGSPNDYRISFSLNDETYTEFASFEENGSFSLPDAVEGAVELYTKYSYEGAGTGEWNSIALRSDFDNSLVNFGNFLEINKEHYLTVEYAGDTAPTKVRLNTTDYEYPAIEYFDGTTLLDHILMPQFQGVAFDDTPTVTIEGVSWGEKVDHATANKKLAIGYTPLDNNYILSSSEEGSGEIVVSGGDKSVETRLKNSNQKIAELKKFLANKIVLPHSTDVYSENDLPTQIDRGDGLGICHHLQANMQYRFVESFSLEYPICFASGGSANELITHNGISITYIGTGAMFRNNSTTPVEYGLIERMSLVGNSGNQVFDITGGVALSIDLTAFEGFGSMGTISNVADFVVFDRATFKNFGEGITLENNGISYLRAVSAFYAVPIGGSIISIAGTFLSTAMTDCQLIPIAGDSGIHIDSGIIGFVTLNHVNIVKDYGGLEYSATSLNQSHPLIKVKASSMASSTVTGEAELVTTQATIEIPVQGAYIIPNVAGWSVLVQERINIDSSGVAEYIGLTQELLPIDRDVKIDQTPSTYEIGIREWIIKALPYDITFLSSANLILETNHGRSDGDTITFHDTAGTLPTELQNNGHHPIYYVVNSQANAFYISYTSGGSPILFSDDGTPTNSYKIIKKHGSEPSQLITAGSAQVLSLKSLSPMSLGDKSIMTVINHDNNNTIRIYSGGYLRI